MSRAAAATVGYDELAALKEVALAGGFDGESKVSCAALADRLDVSSQTASRRLQRLEEAGLVERDVVTDGQWVTTTAAGETALGREYADYRRIFEAERSLRLAGTVTSGMGEGRHYISLPGYMDQFVERLGYEPFPGTLNVDLDDASVRSRSELAAVESIPIDGWEDEERTFGPATCYAATVEGNGDRAGPAHVIVPERTHHDETHLELVAPVKLRDALGLEDGDEVVVRVEGA